MTTEQGVYHFWSLTLPVPPDVNDWPTHHMARHRMKRKYQKEAWISALQQARPIMEPPTVVRVRARFYLWNLRDEDNLVGGLKWAFDALRQKQRGNLWWRSGLFDQCGYFVDDGPKYLTLEEVDQEIDRQNQRLELYVDGPALSKTDKRG